MSYTYRFTAESTLENVATRPIPNVTNVVIINANNIISISKETDTKAAKYDIESVWK